MPSAREWIVFLDSGVFLEKDGGAKWITDALNKFNQLSVLPPLAVSVYDEVFNLRNPELKVAAILAAERSAVLFDLVGL